jgi:Ca2+-binding EF-hand superfamily protein
MNRLALGAILATMLLGLGLFWLQGRAEVERGAPPPPALAALPQGLPTTNVAGLRGPAPPEADELSREQRRFFRYDRNRDLRITRDEMLSSRTEGFRELDKDGNNLLTFEEWAVSTVGRFTSADRNRDGELSQAEFATTAPKPAAKQKCNC